MGVNTGLDNWWNMAKREVVDFCEIKCGDDSWRDDWRALESVYDGSIWEEEESVMDAVEELERLIFREEELGSFEKKVRGYSWRSLNEKVIEFEGDDVDIEDLNLE